MAAHVCWHYRAGIFEQEAFSAGVNACHGLLEDGSLKINDAITKYIVCNTTGSTSVRLVGDTIKRTDQFTSTATSRHAFRQLGQNFVRLVRLFVILKCWLSWKGKFIRPALSLSFYLAVKCGRRFSDTSKVCVSQRLTIMRWICGLTRKDARIHGSLHVRGIAYKIQEYQLRW